MSTREREEKLGVFEKRQTFLLDLHHRLPRVHQIARDLLSMAGSRSSGAPKIAIAALLMNTSSFPNLVIISCAHKIMQ
jgi:hypothetical protein